MQDARRFEENRRAALEAAKLRERQLAIEEEDVVSPMNDGRPTLGGENPCQHLHGRCF